MKTSTISCFIILLFAQLTHALIDTSLDMSRDSNIGQERNGSISSDVDLKTDDLGEDFESSHAMELMRKAQNGKGTYGGANILHRPPGTRSLGSSPTLISSTVVYFSFILVLVFIA